jgi:hypothetical protein
MFMVTAAALARLSTKLDGKKASDGQAFRFTQGTGPDDTAFAHDGRKVLLLDARMAEAMAELTLDVRTTKAGVKLKLDRSTSGSD